MPDINSHLPLNPDLPSSWEIPGVYFSINLTGQGSSVGALDKRLLLVAYRLATGTQPPDQPVLVNGQQDANDFFGQGSDVARLFAAAVSQVGGGVLDLWCCGINEPSGGTQATHLINIAGTASEAGSIDVYVCGYRASIPIASGDAAATVATNLKFPPPVQRGLSWDLRLLSGSGCAERSNHLTVKASLVVTTLIVKTPVAGSYSAPSVAFWRSCAVVTMLIMPDFFVTLIGAPGETSDHCTSIV